MELWSLIAVTRKPGVSQDRGKTVIFIKGVALEGLCHPRHTCYFLFFFSDFCVVLHKILIKLRKG